MKPALLLVPAALLLATAAAAVPLANIEPLSPPAAEKAAEAQAPIEVEVFDVAHDPPSDFVVMLREKTGQRILPVWVGPAEAFAIERQRTGQKLPRPLTHELTADLLTAAGARIEKVQVEDVRDGAFIGRVYLRKADGTAADVDARPSDAIALALGAGAPIFVLPKVMNDAAIAGAGEGKDPFELIRPGKGAVEL